MHLHYCNDFQVRCCIHEPGTTPGSGGQQVHRQVHLMLVAEAWPVSQYSRGLFTAASLATRCFALVCLLSTYQCSKLGRILVQVLVQILSERKRENNSSAAWGIQRSLFYFPSLGADIEQYWQHRGMATHKANCILRLQFWARKRVILTHLNSNISM